MVIASALLIALMPLSFLEDPFSAPLSWLLLLKKAFEAAFSILGGAHAPAQAPLDFLFSVTAQGTNDLQHSAPDLVQRPFSPISFATLHLVRHLLGALAPYPKMTVTTLGGFFMLPESLSFRESLMLETKFPGTPYTGSCISEKTPSRRFGAARW